MLLSMIKILNLFLLSLNQSVRRNLAVKAAKQIFGLYRLRCISKKIG